MGSLANREGRVVGDNQAGIHSTFNGVVGSFVMKAFESCIGATGLSLEMARAEEFDADASISAPSDRAHFFPTEAKMPMQLVFDRKGRRVLGIQAFGAALCHRYRRPQRRGQRGGQHGLRPAAQRGHQRLP
jgi:NADPH-dependent 2,4-dienoyl-CoA reductase/sulfur reductase-like enzyme